MLVLLLMLSSAPVWGRPQAPTPGQADQQPQSQPHSVSTASLIPIVSQSESVGADGSFNFSYETGNGIHVQEGGYIKKVQSLQGQSGALNTDGSQRAIGDDIDSVQVITGAFSYKAPDGTEISLKYIADENGFQPEGAHLPTAPPIPPEIQRALSMLSNKTEQQRSVDVSGDYANQSSQLDPVNAAKGSATNIEEQPTQTTDSVVP